MHQYLRKLVDERNSLTGLMQSVTDKAVAEDRELSDGEAERMRGWQERAAQIDKLAAEQNEYLESQRAWARLQDQLSTTGAEESPARGRITTATRAAAPSWGESFTSSPQFQNYDGHGSSGRVDVAGLFERAAIDSTWVDVPPAKFTPVEQTFTTPLLGVIGRERVSTNSVEWTGYGRTAPAAVVAEGALKPEADLTPYTGAAALETIAHWKGITRQALEDIPRIQSIIEGALRRGVLQKLEQNATTALTTDTDIPAAEGPDLLAAIRVGMATVQSAGYSSPNAVLLNPLDFAELDIAIMSGTVNGPAVGSSYWGMRAIAVASLPAGTAYVGDFKTALTMFERGQAAVYMTDSHADYFLRNTLVILAETRALSVVTQPDAAVKVSATVPPVIP